MTPKQFIEKAWEGGYRISGLEDSNPSFIWVTLKYQIMLDPLAWQAVFGSSIRMDMYDIVEEENRWGYKLREQPIFRWYMHRMIDTLTEGKSIEQFLETL